MNWGSHENHRDHHLHWPHPHWQIPHLRVPHPHWHPHAGGPTTAATYVGRMGMLAVTFGIGTATAAGFCNGCAAAWADSGDSAAGRSGNSSNSQSVSPGPRRSSRSEAPATAIGIVRTPAAGNETTGNEIAGNDTPAVAVARAAASRHPGGATVGATVTKPSSNRTPPVEVHIALPDAVASPVSGAQQETVAMPSLATQDVALSTAASVPAQAQAPAPASVMSTARVNPVSPPLAAVSIPAPPVAQPAVVIASPPIASARIQAVVNGALASLSEALSGGTRTVPADASLALMMGAARRGVRGPAAEIPAATTTTAAEVPAATATTTAAAATKSTTTTTTIETDKMVVSGAGRKVSDRKASGGYAIQMTGAGTVSTTVNLPASTGLTIRAKASAGSPNVTLSLDGQAVTTVVVSSNNWADYTITGVVPAGSHTLAVSTSNATSASSLYLDRVTTMTGPLVLDFSGRAGSAPNNAFWTSKSGSGWDSGVENYTAANTYVDGYGNLVIRAAKTSTGGYTSGWVETKNKVSMGYGTITARMRVPKGQGLWPAFWLKGADEDTTSWPTSGEIDVMELPSTTTTMYSTLHGPIAGSTATQQAQVISNLPDLSADYHNYWVRHLPNEITFGIDGQTLGTLTPDSLPDGATWVYNRPMQAILNMAVGGAWAGAPNSTTPFPSNMSVDWVRWDPPA